MHVNAGTIDGIIFFEGGDIFHAEAGELVGEDAVVQIVKLCNGAQTGVYKFIPGATAATRTVLRSSTELMLDAFRELDENEQDGAQGGPQ